MYHYFMFPQKYKYDCTCDDSRHPHHLVTDDVWVSGTYVRVRVSEGARVCSQRCAHAQPSQSTGRHKEHPGHS